MARRAALGLVRSLTSLLVGRIAGDSMLGVVQAATSTALLLSQKTA